MDKVSLSSEEFGRLVVSSAPLAVCVVDRMGRYLFVNAAAEALTGYSAEELLSRDIGSLVTPEDREKALQTFEHLRLHGTMSCELRLAKKNGELLEVRIETIRLSDNAFCGFHTDITSLKHSEAGLRASEATLRTVIENSSELVMILDPNGVVTYIGPQCMDVLGYPAETFLGKGFPTIIHPDDRDAAAAAYSSVFREHKDITNFEYRIVDAAGATRWLSHSTRMIVADGASKRVHNSLRNITQYKASLDHLAQLQGFNQAILNTSPDLIYVYDVAEHRNVYSNERIHDLLGYSVAEVQAFGERLIAELMHPQDFALYRSQTMARYASARDREVIEHRYRMRHKNGDWRWLHSKEVIFLRSPDGSVRQIFGLIADVTERHQAEIELERRSASLVASEERYRLLFENMQPAFALHQLVENDRGEAVDYIFLEANPAFGAMTGLDPKAIIGRRVTEIIPGIEKDSGDWITRYGRVAQTGLTLNFEQFSETLGKWYQVLAYRPAPGQFVTLFQDMTEKKLLEQRLHQSEKMQAIGHLAGGVAHDFNNQLAGIVGNADLLRLELADKRELALYAENILLAGRRAADLTAQLLAFARKGKYLAIAVNIHKLVTEVVGLLRHTIDRRIHIRQHMDARYPYSVGDPSQLQNALMNLALNARDAMPNGGEIVFETGEEELDAEGCARNLLEIVPGRYLRLSISDTGQGMDQATCARMFEPFFTTKEPGKGTGMGLAAVYGTIKNHGGGIRVLSTPGVGTQIELLLPLAKDLSPEPEEEDTAPSPTRSARVLVVDDESIVLDMCVAMLRKLGCDVMACLDGTTALSTFQANPRSFDLVLLDFVMPEPNGAATFRRMKAIDPAVKVVLCSGYSMEGETQTLMAEGVVGFIPKPFRMSDLSKIIHDLQDGSSAGLR